MLLAVETSCDDSAAAFLDADGRVLAQEVFTQPPQMGGVVPEIASRLHMEVLPGMVSRVLVSAGASLEDVRYFAATAGPGLVGSLLVGLSFAKALAMALNRPFLGINHLAGHIHIHYSGAGEVRFPAVALLVSGGHTALFHMTGWSNCTLLGCTRDDAAGEAFDKTAKMMDLGYPGGKALDLLARTGNPGAVDLPSPLGATHSPEFSFSGLKTAVRLAWESGLYSPEDMAASFRARVCGILTKKLFFQARRFRAVSVLAAGGVTANSLLRESLAAGAARLGVDLLLPPMEHTTDNAVMVGRAALAELDHDPGACSPLSCNAFARWSGEELSRLCC
jgi:N6-L-threonylcarbamoyladenine synthase